MRLSRTQVRSRLAEIGSLELFSTFEFIEHVREIDRGLPFILYTRVEEAELPDGEVPDGINAFLTRDSGREHYRTLAGLIDRAVAESRGMPVDE